MDSVIIIPIKIIKNLLKIYSFLYFIMQYFGLDIIISCKALL